MTFWCFIFFAANGADRDEEAASKVKILFLYESKRKQKNKQYVHFILITVNLPESEAQTVDVFMLQHFSQST